jgi:predicted NUDIX family phosphoesterase
MGKNVLVFPAASCRHLAVTGTTPLAGFQWPDLPIWLPRNQAERDPAFLQLIPYLLLSDPAGGSLWCYERGGGREVRLRSQLSCGIGGHVEEGDSAANLLDTARRCLWREFHEEIIEPKVLNELAPLCWLYEDQTEVGRVHLGLVFTGVWRGEEMPRPATGEGMIAVGFRTPVEIVADERFELWSRLAAERYWKAWRTEVE